MNTNTYWSFNKPGDEYWNNDLCAQQFGRCDSKEVGAMPNGKKKGQWEHEDD